MIHIGGLALREYPLQSSIWPDELPSVHSEAILGANSTLGHSTQAPSPLTESQNAEISDETMAIYVYGRITYNDVFEADHNTEYLYVWKKLPGAPQGILAAYSTGNKAE